MGEHGSDHAYPIFRRVLARAEALERMLARHGRDPLAAVRQDGGTAWLAARRLCILCQQGEACQRVLAAGDVGEVVAPPPPAFCPNRDFIAACPLATRLPPA